MRTWSIDYYKVNPQNPRTPAHVSVTAPLADGCSSTEHTLKL